MVERVGMVLVGRLSNRRFTEILHGLSGDFGEDAGLVRQFASAGAPDGRRKCGSVGDAVVQVLRAAETDLRLKEIHMRVSQLLGGSVSRSSVKSYLARDGERRTPLFERVSRGHYALRQK
jgi:hypothetical protein